MIVHHIHVYTSKPHRKSRRFVISSSDIIQGLSGVLLGSSLSCASVKEGAANECSTISAWTSVSRSPMGPKERTKWPLGYTESTSQKSIRTTILRVLNEVKGHLVILAFQRSTVHVNKNTNDIHACDLASYQLVVYWYVSWVHGNPKARQWPE